jgi:hypothetical protein
MLLKEEEPWGIQTAGPVARFSTKGAAFLAQDTRTFGPEVAAVFDALRHPDANAFHVSLLRHEGDAAATAGDTQGAPPRLSSTGPVEQSSAAHKAARLPAGVA